MKKITQEEANQIYIEAINKFGIIIQLEIVVEELAELIQAIQKYKRYPNDPQVLQNIAEELADVELTTSQLKLMKIVSRESVDKFKQIKLNKLKNKLNK
jgi:NTP pyrophosphatase (non-canonical NTP hydrolase)